ncbi:MAG: hypothetical protein KA118_01885 [Verrucomicrobia bacterium]|nr:hypothetical protein [Verrucomicrobiota bacterium]
MLWKNLVLVVLVWSAWPREVCASFSVRPERADYVVSLGQAFSIPVLIDPIPAAGLFSYGITLWIQGTNAVGTNSIAVSVPSVLDYNGVRGPGALGEVGVGHASVKGTVDFFADPVVFYNGSLLAVFTLTDLAAGAYTLSVDRYATLGATEELFVDGTGAVLDPLLAFPASTLVVQRSWQVLGPPILNLQNGLYQQLCRLRNTDSVARNAFRILLHDLPPGVEVWNAHGETNGAPFFQYNYPLAPEATADLTVEYFVPRRDASLVAQLNNVRFEVQAADPAIDEPPTPTLTIELGHVVLNDGTWMIEFDSAPGRTYFVQYSTDLAVWKTAFPPVTGTGYRVQWIDNGPPKTESLPSASMQRYYRVIAP